MEEIHIRPFYEAKEMIMAAHLHCTCFDSDMIPSSLSKNAIGYLRNKMKFDGVVITDDMVMKGVQVFGSVEACKMAINAGVDMFIFRDADSKTIDVIEDLVEEVQKDSALQQKVLESNQRIKSLKQKMLG